ncbi:MAG TPA: hypothetical protein VE826_05540, partial [Dongiaceae bacterium]|nr:hypothetical protein [Dongiaceae bacterium]
MAEPTAASDSPLSDLIGAVLIDLARAQHESNVYSARLGEIYKRDPLLRPFPVPNGYVTSADITIKLAIGDLGSGLAGPEARLARAQAEFDAFVTRLVPQATALLARALVENADAFPSDTADWLAKTLAETSLQRRLAADVRERVHPVVSQAVSTAGELRWDLAQPAVAAALRDVVVDHGDYARLPQAARQRVYDQIAALTENAPRADALR